MAPAGGPGYDQASGPEATLGQYHDIDGEHQYDTARGSASAIGLYDQAPDDNAGSYMDLPEGGVEDGAYPGTLGQFVGGDVYNGSGNHDNHANEDRDYGDPLYEDAATSGDRHVYGDDPLYDAGADGVEDLANGVSYLGVEPSPAVYGGDVYGE